MMKILDCIHIVKNVDVDEVKQLQVFPAWAAWPLLIYRAQLQAHKTQTSSTLFTHTGKKNWQTQKEWQSREQADIPSPEHLE